MTECVAAHGCITCGDVAAPMRVVKVDSERALALCADPRGERSSVEIALVAPVSPGELLLVHAGTALSRAADQDADPELVHDTRQDLASPARHSGHGRLEVHA
jgi:hydrogenase assembly chaperone HypC/HupF